MAHRSAIQFIFSSRRLLAWNNAYCSLLFIRLIYGCQGSIDRSQKFVVEGQIDTVAHAVYFVSYKQSGTFYDDTVTLDGKGRFTLEGESDEPPFDGF